MIEVRGAASRYRTDQRGITTWHSFSAGAHYDPDNLRFGPITGCDEHIVEPGAGFDWHGHRGVLIVSWVLAGTLRHEDSNGVVRFVRPGVVLVQSSGEGIRHAETNASATDTLRFVQTTVLVDAQRCCELAVAPLAVSGVQVAARGAGTFCAGTHLIVTRGELRLDRGEPLRAGDTVRVTGSDIATLIGDGEVLAVQVDPSDDHHQ